MMKKKIAWFVLICLTILSLILASCGPAAEEEEEVGEAGPEAPEYGGVIYIALSGDPGTFDEATGFMHANAHTLKLTNEELIVGDWAKGPAGTNDADWTIRGLFRWEQKTGCIAESWDFTEPGTLVYHIRKGIHYAINPDSEASQLVNGRELTADDVAFTINYYLQGDKGWIRNGTVGAGRVGELSVTAPDKWTVIIKVPVDMFGDCVIDFSDFASIIPPEVPEKYGNMNEWENSVGTGPFMLTDFIRGSGATLVRNPDYWDKDPVGLGKGNQLPYLDGVKYLIIPDASTREAAIRTAKVDVYCSVEWEPAAELIRTTPQLLYKKHPRDTTIGAIHMRTDKPPFNDIRVRRALMMATDFESLRRDLLGGDALIISWPKTYIREYKDAYLGLDDPELPESVKEMYSYNPKKAKALLAEAGYPDGFKAEITCRTTEADYISAIKDMWNKSDIDLTINVIEPSAYTGLIMSRQYEGMIQGATSPMGGLYKCVDLWGVTFANCSYIDDPYVMKVRDQMQEVWMTDQSEADRLHKEFMKYVLDQAWAIPKPLPPLYHMWWPWIKNYHGEYSIGYDNAYNFTKWVWLDQDLKKSMGH